MTFEVFGMLFQEISTQTIVMLKKTILGATSIAISVIIHHAMLATPCYQTLRVHVRKSKDPVTALHWCLL